MPAPIKYVEIGVSLVANALWYALYPVYKFRQNPSFKPAWSDVPIPKNREKHRPPLGVPRETDSLCPVCTRQARQAILDGTLDLAAIRTQPVGQIKARIVQRGDEIWMEKDCPTHGHFEDILSIDAEFYKKMERLFMGGDIRLASDQLHDHGSSSLKFGRGAVLTVDLTNRCNMMCDPCFTDANQVGFVHELSWPQIKEILDNAMRVRPRRQMSVQFSGGEPTLSPHFLDAVRYAKEVGFNSVQAATNGILFAQSPEFCTQAAEAGLRFVYLQFDGIGNAPNSHRHISNLFDVKLRAIDNLHAAGVDIVPVTTIINGINNEQVGKIVKFALDNPKKISFISFQPVSFTGRDEEVTEERRRAQRYTISHLAHDLKTQIGLGDPSRDWFPMSLMSIFGDWADTVHGPTAAWGYLNCGCHPHCGSGMIVTVDKETNEAVPVSAFLNPEKFFKDIVLVNDAARGRFLTALGMALSILRHWRPFEAPTHLTMKEMLVRFDKGFGATHRDYGRVGKDRTLEDIKKRRSDRFLFLYIAGMWFQDLWTYDFRRTEMCIIPYGTQEGEISFCAYNTGLGWRQIIEKRHMTASLSQWYAEKGRHPIYAGNHDVAIEDTPHSLHVDPVMLTTDRQHDLEKVGIAITARDERLRARQQGLIQIQRRSAREETTAQSR